MFNFNKIKGFLNLVRPELPFSAGVCVILGEIIALGSLPSFSIMFLGFIYGFFLSGSAMILNDIFDIEVDRVNSPERPLPSGMISSKEAIIFASVITGLGLLSALLVGSLAVILYIVFWLVGFLYNWKFKEKGFFGNLFVSISVGFTNVFGGIVVDNPWSSSVLIFGLMIFLFDLSEEIAADTMDVEGDKKRNIKSIPILIGRKKSMYISSSLLFLEVLVSYLPLIFDFFGTSYLILISVTNMIILFLGIKLLKSQSIKKGRFYVRLLYLMALPGMFFSIISNLIF
ncbi:MAG: prenyltransferase [Candidatus Mcinerneyibacterium aminivorans]|uniref:Prenyltransferase n=1 Tax=Candidatus Mcinerneyibacterium aminivorans TaxID=2703815 RepID=A0A5D0MFS9_9BACT|nr:MAG: prenyltransferase [Candidatus Mcinerneyibacterium aminivorans]